MAYKVAVIMGSDSDLEVMRPAIKTLAEFGIEYEAHVISAHRTPDRAASFAREAKEKGFGVIIAAAGKAAHLAGVLAAHTTLPVIGVPVKSSTLDGLDALLSTVQMPAGVPVAMMSPGYSVITAEAISIIPGMSSTRSRVLACCLSSPLTQSFISSWVGSPTSSAVVIQGPTGQQVW